jgi:hypothetical protein
MINVSGTSSFGLSEVKGSENEYDILSVYAFSKVRRALLQTRKLRTNLCLPTTWILFGKSVKVDCLNPADY